VEPGIDKETEVLVVDVEKILEVVDSVEGIGRGLSFKTDR